MKHLNLHFKWLVMSLLLCLCSSAWAEGTTGTINFGNASGSTKIEGASSSGTGTVTYTDTGNDSQGNTWTITTVTSNGKSFTQNASYSQVGASSKPVTSITFTTTLAENVNITSLSAKFSGFSGTAGTVTLKVGDTTVGTGSLNGTNNVTVSSSTIEFGKVLTITVTDIAKGVACYYISYTYSSSVTNHNATFSVNGATTTQEFAEGAAITFPKNPADIEGKKFMGWVSEEISGTTDIAPTFVTSANMGEADVTYYAVFATVEGESGWFETAIGNMSASDVFVFSDGSYAMGNDNGSSSAPEATAITVESGKITSTVTDDLKWNVSGNATDGYVFYPNGSTTTWLYCNTTTSSSNNNNIRVGNGNRNLWEFDNSGYLVTKDDNTDRYLSLYNSQDFRGYINTSNGAFVPKFYKYSLGNISSYCTTVVADPVLATTSVTLNDKGYATFASTSALDFRDAANEDFSAWQITGVTSTAITFTQITTTVAAGQGILLKGEPNATINIYIQPNGGDILTGNKLEGFTTATAIADNAYYGLFGDKFQRVSAGTVPAGKALLPAGEIPSSAKSLNFVLEDETTGLLNEKFRMNNEESSNDIYDLSGRKLSVNKSGTITSHSTLHTSHSLRPGLYIVNGKIVLIK